MEDHQVLDTIDEVLTRAPERPGSSLATFGEYMQARQVYIPDYWARWRACRYIGSGQVEKANDLLVARRQKGRGMQWSGEMIDAPAYVQSS